MAMINKLGILLLVLGLSTLTAFNRVTSPARKSVFADTIPISGRDFDRLQTTNPKKYDSIAWMIIRNSYKDNTKLRHLKNAD